jgi:hypothetical protein
MRNLNTPILVLTTIRTGQVYSLILNLAHHKIAQVITVIHRRHTYHQAIM